MAPTQRDSEKRRSASHQQGDGQSTPPARTSTSRKQASRKVALGTLEETQESARKLTGTIQMCTLTPDSTEPSAPKG